MLCASLFQLMTDVVGNPEEERHADFYQAPWVPEAVGRYVYSKVSLQGHARSLRHHIRVLERQTV